MLFLCRGSSVVEHSPEEGLVGCSIHPRGTTLSVVHGTLSVPQKTQKNNMYYVYILLSGKDGKLYIGSTPDLKKRIEKHEHGYVLATKHRQPIKATNSLKFNCKIVSEI